jgi:hypothetical protein
MRASTKCVLILWFLSVLAVMPLARTHYKIHPIPSLTGITASLHGR